MAVLEILIVLLVTALIAFYQWKFNYWKKRNLPYLQPHFPLGNVKFHHLKSKPGFIFQNLYTQMKKNGWKHGGVYILTNPLYLVVDLEYVKTILTKDFDHFDDRGVYYNEKDDPLSAHLLYLGGGQWKTLRTKLNPSFTSSKIKSMFPIMENCAENLVKKIRNETTPVDIEKIISCFTIDNIGSCAFGLECGMFDDDSPFEFCAKKCPEMSRLSLFTLIIASMFPNFARTLHLRHYSKEVSSFFLKLARDCVHHRQETSSRQDLMQLLIKLYDERLLTIEEIAAQSLIFFIAGYETSTLATTFALYELAKNQEIQERARNEINAAVRKCGKMTHEAVLGAKYLNQIIDETMRKYPAVMYLTRRCTKNYSFPNGATIEKGTIVIIPNYAIHHDEEFYPQPEKFDPERFNEECKSFRDHYAHLPFGEGPRICIGKRFGLMVVKVALFSLLRNFKLTLNSRTTEPLNLAINSVVLRPEGKIWLNVHEL